MTRERSMKRERRESRPDGKMSAARWTLAREVQASTPCKRLAVADSPFGQHSLREVHRRHSLIPFVSLLQFPRSQSKRAENVVGTCTSSFGLNRVTRIIESSFVLQRDVCCRDAITARAEETYRDDTWAFDFHNRWMQYKRLHSPGPSGRSETCGRFLDALPA